MKIIGNLMVKVHATFTLSEFYCQFVHYKCDVQIFFTV